MGLDTLFVNLENAYGTLWNSSCPMVSFDVLGSLSDAVHEAGMQLYGIYDLSFVAGDGSMQYMRSVNAETLDQSAKQIAELASESKLDGILLEGYLNPETENSYDEFTRSGENVSLDTYMTQNTQIWLKCGRDHSPDNGFSSSRSGSQSGLGNNTGTGGRYLLKLYPDFSGSTSRRYQSDD